MKTLIDSYGEVVRNNIDFICKLQTFLALIAAALVIAANQHLSQGPGPLAVVLALLSIPSAAWWAKRRIRRYEQSGRRQSHPDFDFSGKWKLEGRFLHAFRLVAHEPLPPSQQGNISIAQTPFWIALSSSNIVSTANKTELGGWSWLSASLSDSGKQIYAAYKIDEMPDPAVRTLRSEGYGFETFTVTEWDPPTTGGRPRIMRNLWYDCAQGNDAILYIGEAAARRVDF
jgi:hypothetical protein